MRLAKPNFWPAFWVLALVIAGFVTWFMGSLLYTFFWTALGQWGFPITEAQMAAYIAAHLVPFLFVLVAAGLFSLLIRNQIATADTHADVLATSPAMPTQVLQIEVGETGPFFSTTGSSLYDIKRTFNIKLTNVHKFKTVTNCKIFVTKIEPQDEYFGPWLLKEIPSLASGEHSFIPLARYGEARNPKTYDCADSFFTTYLGSPGRPALDVGKSYVFTLRAIGTDSPMCEVRCKLWVDEAGRFRIEQV